MLTLSRAHDIQGDCESTFRGVPLDSSGQKVDLQPFMESASFLAKQLLAMLEARARAAKEAQLKPSEDA